MEDKSNSPDELEESILAYIKQSNNLFQLGNELNTKLDNFKLEINSLQNEFITELNSIKLFNQFLSEKILKIIKNRHDLNSKIQNSNDLPKISTNIETTDENFLSDNSNSTRIDMDQASPKSPSIISHNYNLKAQNSFLSEDEAFSKLYEMAKKDGFSIDQMKETDHDQINVTNLDLTLKPEKEINKNDPSLITKKCIVKLNQIDLFNLDSLIPHKLSLDTINYLNEHKSLNEELEINRLCKMNFNIKKNSARKKTEPRQKNMVRKKPLSDSDSDALDTSSSELTNDQIEGNYRDKLVQMMESDNFEITEDESMVDSESTAILIPPSVKDEESNDSSNTCVTIEETKKLIVHEYRDSKQTPGYTKNKMDIPQPVLESIETDEEKENKIPRNEESDEEIKVKRCSKRLTSETSDEKECSQDDEDFMENAKKSACFKGVITGELDDADNLELDNSDTNSSEIKPLVKKRKKHKSGSDSENSNKRITRLSARKEELNQSDENKDSDDSDNDESRSLTSDSDIQTIHSSDEESPQKQETRHKLRNIIHEGKLTKETLDAIQTERERKKRVEEKKCLEEAISDDKTNDLYLDVDLTTKQLLLKVDPALSKHLKPHQVEGVKFMWNSCYESCEMIQNGHKGSGCLLAHCMGLGKTFQVITFVHTLLTNKDLTKCKRVLIMFPVNVLQNWKKEFRKWTKPCKKQITVYLLPNEKGFSKDLARARLNEIETWYRKGKYIFV